MEEKGDIIASRTNYKHATDHFLLVDLLHHGSIVLSFSIRQSTIHFSCCHISVTELACIIFIIYNLFYIRKTQSS